MRLGVVLPHFRHRAEAALAVARRADEAGLDGVFCYDHLWPMGQPQRPALSPFPLLGAVAVHTSDVAIGTLVARVGVVPDTTLVGQFEALELLAPGRVVAGLGTGDAKSSAENRAYGLASESAASRREAVLRCATELRRLRIRVWVGGASPAMAEVARRADASLNVWDAHPSRPPQPVDGLEVTWGGPAPAPSGARLSSHLATLEAAGYAWAVFGPAPDPFALAAARRATLWSGPAPGER